MSLPDLAPTPPPTRPDSTAVTAILDAAAQHRLHAAMVLVGVHRVPAPVVLDLVWPQIHPDACEIRVPGLTVHLDPATVELLHWHGCRQHLDRRRAGPAWRQSVRVFVDEVGRPYSEANADEAVTIAAARAGLPPVPLTGLRDLAVPSPGGGGQPPPP
jgi:hypothetical protein